jgi:hypothetical protein
MGSQTFLTVLLSSVIQHSIHHIPHYNPISDILLEVCCGRELALTAVAVVPVGGTVPAIKTLNEALLAGIPPGTWVAISEDQEKVVATGETIELVMELARQNGHPHPFVIRIPSENLALIL